MQPEAGAKAFGGIQKSCRGLEVYGIVEGYDGAAAESVCRCSTRQEGTAGPASVQRQKALEGLVQGAEVYGPPKANETRILEAALREEGEETQRLCKMLVDVFRLLPVPLRREFRRLARCCVMEGPMNDSEPSASCLRKSEASCGTLVESQALGERSGLSAAESAGFSSATGTLFGEASDAGDALYPRGDPEKGFQSEQHVGASPPSGRPSATGGVLEGAPLEPPVARATALRETPRQPVGVKRQIMQQHAGLARQLVHSQRPPRGQPEKTPLSPPKRTLSKEGGKESAPKETTGESALKKEASVVPKGALKAGINAGIAEEGFCCKEGANQAPKGEASTAKGASHKSQGVLAKMHEKQYLAQDLPKASTGPSKVTGKKPPQLQVLLLADQAALSASEKDSSTQHNALLEGPPPVGRQNTDAPLSAGTKAPVQNRSSSLSPSTGGGAVEKESLPAAASRIVPEKSLLDAVKVPLSKKKPVAPLAPESLCGGPTQSQLGPGKTPPKVRTAKDNRKSPGPLEAVVRSPTAKPLEDIPKEGLKSAFEGCPNDACVVVSEKSVLPVKDVKGEDSGPSRELPGEAAFVGVGPPPTPPVLTTSEKSGKPRTLPSSETEAAKVSSFPPLASPLADTSTTVAAKGEGALGKENSSSNVSCPPEGRGPPPRIAADTREPASEPAGSSSRRGSRSRAPLTVLGAVSLLLGMRAEHSQKRAAEGKSQSPFERCTQESARGSPPCKNRSDVYKALDSPEWSSLTRGWSDEEWSSFVLGEEQEGQDLTAEEERSEEKTTPTATMVRSLRREHEDGLQGDVQERVLPVTVFYCDTARPITVYDEVSEADSLRAEDEEGVLGICIRKAKYLRGSRIRRQRVSEGPAPETPFEKGHMLRSWGVMKERMMQLQFAPTVHQQQQRALEALSLGRSWSPQGGRTSPVFSSL
ncbi:hypothetical protein cyc_06285 [Cyclospora cayetanensis]|uniref:Uncharacterized protein n=1 Tax=Cyclospora cayetanensis TaxID=88456 RepID=A0A1D3CRG5_9EIME|nr:hypothetical protein cyc_06285 [Cyclospora cayetanensis]